MNGVAHYCLHPTCTDRLGFQPPASLKRRMMMLITSSSSSPIGELRKRIHTPSWRTLAASASSLVGYGTMRVSITDSPVKLQLHNITRLSALPIKNRLLGELLNLDHSIIINPVNPRVNFFIDFWSSVVYNMTMEKKNKSYRPKPKSIGLTHRELVILSEMAMRQAAERGVTISVIPRGVAGEAVNKWSKHRNKRGPGARAKMVTLSSASTTTSSRPAQRHAHRPPVSLRVSSES